MSWTPDPPPGAAVQALVPAPSLRGLRLVIDPGHGGYDAGHSLPGRPTEAEWTLDVGGRLAQLCAAAGATVALTRGSDSFVPRLVRRAYAEESRADIALSLHLGPPRGHSAAAVLFGRAWWQARRAGRLSRCVFEALDRRMPLHRLPGGGRRAGACAVQAGRWTTLALLMVAYPAVDGSGLDAAAWAGALAEGLEAFCALPSGARRLAAPAAPFAPSADQPADRQPREPLGEPPLPAEDPAPPAGDRLPPAEDAGADGQQTPPGAGTGGPQPPEPAPVSERDMVGRIRRPAGDPRPRPAPDGAEAGSRSGPRPPREAGAAQPAAPAPDRDAGGVAFAVRRGRPPQTGTFRSRG